MMMLWFTQLVVQCFINNNNDDDDNDNNINKNYNLLISPPLILFFGSLPADILRNVSCPTSTILFSVTTGCSVWLQRGASPRSDRMRGQRLLIVTLGKFHLTLWPYVRAHSTATFGRRRIKPEKVKSFGTLTTPMLVPLASDLDSYCGKGTAVLKPLKWKIASRVWALITTKNSALFLILE